MICMLLKTVPRRTALYIGDDQLDHWGILVVSVSTPIKIITTGEGGMVVTGSKKTCRADASA